MSERLQERETRDDTYDPFTESFQFVLDCLRYFGPEHCAVAFNGGKDCTAVLDLVDRAYSKFQDSSPEKTMKTIALVYIENGTEFEEMGKFIVQTRQKYAPENTNQHNGTVQPRFRWCHVKHDSIRDALNEWQKSAQDVGIIGTDMGSYASLGPFPLAIFMGSRITDPHCSHLSVISQSDHETGWPRFDRLNPILNWSYQDVWSYILSQRLAYCSLYDQGYTSVGHADSSAPNARLQWNCNGTICYRPAYELTENDTEREGRHVGRSSQQQQKPSPTTPDDKDNEAIDLKQADQDQDLFYMTIAKMESKKCISCDTAYDVGAVLVDSTDAYNLQFTGYSRELPGNTHAEECCFLKYEHWCKERDVKTPYPLSKTFTLYTTMEPCSTRLSGKSSCLEKCLQAKIQTVVFGSFEPKTFVADCIGIATLKQNGITVRQA